MSTKHFHSAANQVISTYVHLSIITRTLATNLRLPHSHLLLWTLQVLRKAHEGVIKLFQIPRLTNLVAITRPLAHRTEGGSILLSTVATHVLHHSLRRQAERRINPEFRASIKIPTHPRMDDYNFPPKLHGLPGILIALPLDVEVTESVGVVICPSVSYLLTHFNEMANASFLI